MHSDSRVVQIGNIIANADADEIPFMAVDFFALFSRLEFPLLASGYSGGEEGENGQFCGGPSFFIFPGGSRGPVSFHSVRRTRTKAREAAIAAYGSCIKRLDHKTLSTQIAEFRQHDLQHVAR